jgi:ATP-dependent HslUV protease subunit HslV
MTTIAYRSGTLAGDTQVSGDIKTYSTKVFKLKNGSLAAGAGDFSSIHAFIDWLQRPKSERPDLTHDDDFEALVISEDGVIEWYDQTLRSVPVEQEFYAIGSGAAVAIGAMEMGATAEQAVAAGIKWDTLSGGEVRSVALKAR